MDFEYNIRGLLHLFFKQKNKFLLTFLIILTFGLVAVMNMEPYYETKSSLLLKFGENARLEVNLQGAQGYKPSPHGENAEILSSNVSILESADLIKKVVSKMEAVQLYPALGDQGYDDRTLLLKAVRQAQKKLTVVPGIKNNLIEISFRHSSPESSSAFINNLIKAYKERHTEIYNPPQITFLEEQTKKTKDQLSESQSTFNVFKKEMGVSEIDKEIEQLLKQKNELSAIAYQSVAKAQEILAEMETREATMKATYKPDSPLVKRLQEGIAVARYQLRQRKDDMAQTSLGNNSLAKQTSSIDKRITWLEEQRGQYNELKQKVDLDEENFKYYRQRTEEARVNYLLNAQDITQISVIDAPGVPLQPTGPNKKIIAIAILMLGLFAATAVTIAFELMNDCFSFPNQIRARLGVPVLATFSKAEKVL